MNDLAKKTFDALRKTDNTFLNYVLVPMPTNDAFDDLAKYIDVPSDITLDIDDSFNAYRNRQLAKKQTELVLNAIAKITGNRIISKSHAYITPSIMTDDGFGFGKAQVLASIDVNALPSIDEACAYHSDYDFKALLQEAIDTWSAIRKHDINTPFIDWSRHSMSFYLWLLMRCEKSDGELISIEDLTAMLGNELAQAMQD